jgi:hypothetical protein
MLNHFARDYVIGDFGYHVTLTNLVVESLLMTGHIYKARSGVYAAFPTYAVQRDEEEWRILGDARVDTYLKTAGPVLEITCTLNNGILTLERQLLATYDEARRLFEAKGITLFDTNKLLKAIPDTEQINAPTPLQDFVPSPYQRWDCLDDKGRWEQQASPGIDQKECLTQGLMLNDEGEVVRREYFFRHVNGWSPLTRDEASLLMFKTAEEAGHPYHAQYNVSDNRLSLPLGLPYSAYVALQYIGNKFYVRNNMLNIEGIDQDVSSIICRKLSIRLDLEVKP